MIKTGSPHAGRQLISITKKPQSICLHISKVRTPTLMSVTPLKFHRTHSPLRWDKHCSGEICACAPYNQRTDKQQPPTQIETSLCGSIRRWRSALAEYGVQGNATGTSYAIQALKNAVHFVQHQGIPPRLREHWFPGGMQIMDQHALLQSQSRSARKPKRHISDTQPRPNTHNHPPHP
jgi:hypothetical protein